MLTLETQVKKTAETPVELLETYLNKARIVSDSTEKGVAKKAIAKNFESSADMLAEFKKSPDAERIVKAKEKALKKEAASFDLKTKLNYATDAEFGGGMSALLAAGIVSGATTAFGSVAMNEPSAMSATVMLGALGYTLSQGTKAAVAFATEAKTQKQEKDIEAYSDIKHTQLALKLLKRDMQADKRAQYKAEVNKLLADGYGNPGGVVTVPYTKDAPKNNPAAEPKSDKKSSYKEEVAKLYAAYGNPSGGFVHNALAGKKRDR